MNTIHRPSVDATQRIYERNLGLRQAQDRQKERNLMLRHSPEATTPWDLSQECPKIAPGSNMARFEGENEQCSEADAQDALEPFNGHSYQQIAFSALVLLGAGLLCLLGGMAFGAWIALERFGL